MKRFIILLVVLFCHFAYSQDAEKMYFLHNIKRGGLGLASGGGYGTIGFTTFMNLTENVQIRTGIGTCIMTAGKATTSHEADVNGTDDIIFPLNIRIYGGNHRFFFLSGMNIVSRTIKCEVTEDLGGNKIEFEDEITTKDIPALIGFEIGRSKRISAYFCLGYLFDLSSGHELKYQGREIAKIKFGNFTVGIGQTINFGKLL
jgi:hypothetical protein